MLTRVFSILALFIVIGTALQKDKPIKLKYTDWFYLPVPEPSDIALSPEGNSYYIVSDDEAAVYEIDFEGKLIRRSETMGIDLEAVCARPDYLYVVDETPRKVYRLDYQTLSKQRTFSVPYAGGRNKGFESIAYNEQKKCFVLVTERDPVIIFEYDADFRQINEYNWNHARDISAAIYHEDHIWLLSDEDMTVFKCSAQDYKVLQKYKINVHNPEGLLFHGDQMLIVSDDMERLYFFKHPERR